MPNLRKGPGKGQQSQQDKKPNVGNEGKRVTKSHQPFFIGNLFVPNHKPAKKLDSMPLV
jgi:hypothetical protein